MIPRMKLDIGWSDIFYAAKQSFARDSITSAADIESLFDTPTLVCLSVRSGFDAVLSALNYPQGSEVLVSAFTIRDMARIIEEHGLVAVPVDLDTDTLGINQASLKKAMTKNTRAILVSHLFGARMSMAPVIKCARKYKLDIFEDCAQAWAADRYRGNANSTVRMFSFGTIKTATACGGALLHFRDSELWNAAVQIQNKWPMQSRKKFLIKLCRNTVLKILSFNPLYSFFCFACNVLRLNRDTIINASVRGFAGGNFFKKIRQKPSSPLVALLHRRLTTYDPARITMRMQAAKMFAHFAKKIRQPGDDAPFHTYWVFPILHPKPNQLMLWLWKKGFDATRGASSMGVVYHSDDPGKNVPLNAIDAESQLLYIPVYAGMSAGQLKRLARAIEQFDSN